MLGANRYIYLYGVTQTKSAKNLKAVWKDEKTEQTAEVLIS